MTPGDHMTNEPYGPALVARWRALGTMPDIGTMAPRYKCDHCGRPVAYLTPIICKRLLCAPCTKGGDGVEP